VAHVCKPSEIKPRYYLGFEEFVRETPAYKDEKLANSLLNYGMRQPIIVDRNMGLVSGERRLRAAKQVGMKQVPFIIGDFHAIIAAMRAERANEDPEYTVEMGVIDKLKMIMVLRAVGKPTILAARAQITSEGGRRRHGLAPRAAREPITPEDDIQTVVGLGTPASCRVLRRFIVPVFGPAAEVGHYQIRTPPNREAALKALEEYEHGRVGSHNVWKLYLQLSNPLPPQPMKLWEQTIGAITEHVENVGPMIDRLKTPPVEMTPEIALQWANDLAARMKPLRVLVSQLRKAGEGKTNEENENEGED
jgi:hypothetical protein